MATAESAIAVVAAEPRELAGLVAHATSVTALRWPVRYALEAMIGGQRWLLLAHGAGASLAAQAAQTAVDRGPLRALISVGLCGGLEPELKTGDIVAATEVRLPAPNVTRYAVSAPADWPRPRVSGPVVCSPRVVCSAEQKRALHSTGAVAVEMESAGVAEVAVHAGVPFYCIKGVSDPAQETLPLDFNRYRDVKGNFLSGRIALAALLRPHRLPALARLLRASRQTSIKLGEFLANCKF